MSQAPFRAADLVSTRVPLRVIFRELLLAALPFLLSVALFTFATLPAFRVLRVAGNVGGIYAYQGLVQDVQTYQVTRLRPGSTAEEKFEAQQRARSSTQNPAQFTALKQVETFGDARLAHIDALLARGTEEALAQASAEAVRLNAQAANYVTSVSQRNVKTMYVMRWALIATAVLTGLLSMLLIGRALWLWRAERERQVRRDARQREALSLASHELRRPLQQLLLASDLLRQVEDVQQRQELLSRIEDSAAQIASRADLSRLNDLYLDVNLHLARRDVGAVVRAVVGNQARIHLTLPPAPLIWWVDQDRLRQMVENLIENALKYTSGPVEVSVAEEDGQPAIRVRDHGEGIPSSLLENVFLPYERGPRGLVQGQGLGLSLVRRYAHAHGGEVTLQPASDGPGLLALLTLGQPEDRAVTAKAL